MKHSFFLILTFVCAMSSGQTMKHEWATLDDAVSKGSTYIEQKQQRIDRMKNDLSVASFASDRYIITKKLYNEYKKLHADSALVYANRCLELGEQENRTDWEKEAQLCLIEIYVLSGHYITAEKLLESYGNIEDFPRQLHENMAAILMEMQTRLYGEMAKTPLEEAYKQKIADRWEEYRKYIEPTSGLFAHYQRIATSSCDAATEQRLKDALARMPQDTEDRAVLEFSLANLMQQKGDSTAYIHHLIQAAICDIRTANRESGALSRLISILSQQNDMKKAFRYALFCGENAMKYQDRGKSLNIMENQFIIQQGYQKSVKSYLYFIYVILSAVTVLCAVIIGLFFRLRSKARKQQKTSQELEHTNNLLKTMNEELQRQIDLTHEMSQKVAASNALLHEEIKKRESHIVNIFYLCSGYIHEWKNYRKKIYNLMQNGLNAEARKLASSSIIGNAEQEKLHQQFDSIFTSIHPDFVERFNRLLRPEEQIATKDNHSLTPELRIYALIYLGISDSVRIADFLHYSTQTVYNYRFKMRHASHLPDKEFVTAVKELYGDERR